MKDIEFFNSFVFRTPIQSFNGLESQISQLETDEDWKEILSNCIFQEAIFIASPILYEETQKFLSGNITKNKDIERLKITTLKYLTRMSTRCTPFGLFAGVSTGSFALESKITIHNLKNIKRHTRLDMSYLCNLIRGLSNHIEIKNKLFYYPNTSLCFIGNQIRYVEYRYVNTKRIHEIVSVENSKYIQNILNAAKGGSTINELSNILLNDDISIDEANEFILLLIDSQLLVSELEPRVTECDLLGHIISVLNKLEVQIEIKDKLVKIKKLLRRIDHSLLGNAINYYKDIEKIVKEIGVEYEQQYLFQCDIYKPTISATLKMKIQEQIKDALSFLNKITLPYNKETPLMNFIKQYNNRYEGREMPLVRVLDVETGIDYPFQRNSDITPLLNDYVLPQSLMSNYEIRWNRIQEIIHNKLCDVLKNKEYIMSLEENDFDFLDLTWSDISNTISVICEIFKYSKDSSKIYLHFSGGSSASNLLARFCHIDKSIHEHTEQIIEYEEEVTEKDNILAEIVHFPESRIGNILLHPILRKYEIPYLSLPNIIKENVIDVNDIMVSVKGNDIILRSKRLNKRILPRLTSAHNFSNSVLPIYHFLCDIQMQNSRGGVGFNWGVWTSDIPFLPRVEYENIILTLARWKIIVEDFKGLFDFESNCSTLNNICNWCEKQNIPQYVVLPDGDNRLFIDMCNIWCLKMLYSVIKKRSYFILEEFPFDKKQAIVNDDEGNVYTNEFIFAIKCKKEK
jgi:hypothetical protein